MKKILVILSSMALIIVCFACTIKSESSVNLNVNGTNVIDAKTGFDTENPDLVSASVNTSKYRTINFGKLDGRPISWYVIAEDDEHALLLSEKIIDTMPFNTKNVKVDWTNSTLFDYLNTDFINECFTSDEQKQIAFVNNSDDAKVTMLSLNNLIDVYGKIYYIPDEYYGVKDYFEANKDIIAKPSQRAIKNDIEVYENTTFAEIMGQEVDKRYEFANGHSAYWVINTTEESSDVFLVTATGYINHLEPDRKYIGVRPVIRMKK